MSPESYFMSCYRILYDRHAHITSFGEPMNCYGFVYWYYRLCKGIELPSYEVETFDNVSCISYNEVKAPSDGDVVSLKTLDGIYAVHVGILYHGAVFHFTSQGLLCKRLHQMLGCVKGFYHVA